ncbi:DUF676-domain-containing protein [Dendrothele bispora CBS 962.96]|uniref:DUF676-domain-containing protein n=1 Tax=Dendrothele bispora (strain CBS 962.96) TaxID=1314807 RepID=A0A4S8LKZ1_DENBC|nr:DUF676-domain-containing protein [Dendrothele bispora CBS 962.96]
MQVHLHVLLHGLWGNTKHFESAARVFNAKHGTRDDESQNRVQLLIVEANEGTKTYDGIEWGAERAAKEIMEAARRIEEKDHHTIDKFSITGYSLGGLYARYVIAILHASDFFANVQPMNFVTIATPHIGIPRTDRSLFSRLAKVVGSHLLGNTGQQLYGIDNWAGTGRAWLEVASDRSCVFWNALNAFHRIDIYANAINDRTVPYVSGAFEFEDPFTKVNIEKAEVEFEAGYEPILKSWCESKVPRKLSLSQRFQAWKPLPYLGPFRQWNFPYNLILMVMLPMILSVLLFLLPMTFLLNTRASRSRVLTLQKLMNEEETYSTRMKLLTQVEQAAGNVVGHTEPAQATSDKGLSLSQRQMIKNLNQLSNLHKHLVWIHPVRNSHAIIICREESQFPDHSLGEGVLRHWVDHFAL